MIKLTVCFVIVNLALANAFYGFTKKYEYPLHTDLIISDEPYGFNKLAYGVCKGNEPERKCKIYQELVQDEYNSAVQICDVNLNSTRNLNIQNLGQTNVILTMKNSRNVTLLTLNMGTCSMKETIIEADEDKAVQIVPKGDSYDVVFKNDDLCGELYCIATYDLNGMIVMKAVPFGSFNTRYTVFVDKIDSGYLVTAGINDDIDFSSMTGYYVNDDLHRFSLFGTSTYVDPRLYSSSTAENGVGLCMSVGRPDQIMILCRKFIDKVLGSSIVGTKINILTHPLPNWASTGVLNLKKGLLVLLREAGKWGRQMPPTINVYDEQGKLTKKFEDIDLACKDGLSTPKVFQNIAGDACITSICRDNYFQNKFSRTYKCIPKYQLD